MVPPNKSYVVDQVEHLVISDCNYRPLDEIDDDVLLLEWDITVERDELKSFAARAKSSPDSVLVAPYKLYYPDLPAPVWAHRLWDGNPPDSNFPAGTRPVIDEQPTCNLFGLGVIYLPRKIVRAFVASNYSRHFGDVEFSMWHYRNVCQQVPIDWETRPIHLNYQVEGLI